MVIPYQSDHKGKKEQVEGMFDNIASKYDFLNHFLSLGIDKLWRRRAIDLLRDHHPRTILDIATGTGDLAIAACRLRPDKVTGIDISSHMLQIGREKISKKRLDHLIVLQTGDSEQLAFADDSFDAAIVAFGVRNFENLEKGLSEIHRVLKKESLFVVLEFSSPSAFPVKQVFGFYFSFILPLIGKIVSKDRSAYTYLPESVKAFPEGKIFMSKLEEAGFTSIRSYPQSLGIATIYTGIK